MNCVVANGFDPAAVSNGTSVARPLSHTQNGCFQYSTTTETLPTLPSPTTRVRASTLRT